jgi:hypothetical protein
MRNGRRIEVVVDNTLVQKRKTFQAEFIQVPAYWIKALRGAHGTTYQLAHAILEADFERRHKRRGGGVVLSKEVTGLLRSSRQRATKALLQLGLIEVEIPEGRCAPRVTKLLHTRKRAGT